MNTNKNQSSWDFLPVPARFRGLTFAVVILFLFVTAAYAVNPVIQSVLNMDSGLREVNSSELGHSLNLSQIVEGVTITLDWAYADENRIAVAYTIIAENDQLYEPANFTLTNSTGYSFPSTTGMITSVSGESGYVFSFDASSITNDPKTLDLQLNLWLESPESKELIEPVSFNFTVPFTPGRIAEPKQNYTAEGITITLEKVTLTPSDLTAVICFNGPDNEYEWIPISHIDVINGEDTARATNGSLTNPDEFGCTTNHYFPSLYNDNGNWSLTVTELVGTSSSPPKLVGINSYPSEKDKPHQLRISGDWIFEFDLP